MKNRSRGRSTSAKRKRQAHRRVESDLSVGENGTKPKRKRDGAAKRQALIHAALGLFAAKGYEATTTREIAASAGCAEGLIHRYFKGKAGLLAAMIEHPVQKQQPGASRQLRPASNLTEEFLRLVDQEVERIWESRDILRVLIPRAIVDPSVGSLMRKTLSSEAAQAISDRLNWHEGRVTLPQSGLEVLAQAVEMLGLLFGFVHPVVLGYDRLGAKKMAAAVARIMVGGTAVPVPV